MRYCSTEASVAPHLSAAFAAYRADSRKMDLLSRYIFQCSFFCSSCHDLGYLPCIFHLEHLSFAPAPRRSNCECTDHAVHLPLTQRISIQLQLSL